MASSTKFTLSLCGRGEEGREGEGGGPLEGVGPENHIKLTTYSTDRIQNTEYSNRIHMQQNSCTKNYQCTYFFIWRLDFTCSMSGPKKVSIFRAYPFQWPSKWIFPHKNHYVPLHINNRYINSYNEPQSFVFYLKVKRSMEAFRREVKQDIELLRKELIHEQEAARIAHEQEAGRKAQEQEVGRKAHEQEAGRKAHEQEAGLMKEQAEQEKWARERRKETERQAEKDDILALRKQASAHKNHRVNKSKKSAHLTGYYLPVFFLLFLQKCCLKLRHFAHDHFNVYFGLKKIEGGLLFL